MIEAIKNNCPLSRGWLLSVFGILPSTTEHGHLEKFGIATTNGIMHVNINNKIETIDDYTTNKPLFEKTEHITLKAHDVLCLSEDITTTYGILIVNYLLIQYPYDGKIKYINSEITPKLINHVAYETLTKDIASIDEHLKFENATNYLMCLAQVAIPSATERSIAPNPQIIIEKTKLLKEYKDRMDDPAAVSELQAKISKLDSDYLIGDPSERFFITGKAALARLRMMGMYGAEQDYHDETKISVMTNSLDEGWDIKDIPMLANNIRGGSYSRAQDTALGGAEVKITGRIFQNYKIVTIPCNTTRGLKVEINHDNYTNYIGRYIVGDSDHPLTLDKLKHSIGKDIIVRSPTYCTSDGTSLCCKCMGDIISNSGLGMTVLMNGITNSFLSLFLALIHGSTLSTYKYSYVNRIS